MFGLRSHDHTAKALVSRDEFLDLLRQPCAQPTLATLLEEHLGYCVSGAHETTEVRSLTGDPIALDTLCDKIESDHAFGAMLHDAIVRLRT
jgi:hypothetical protein